MPHTPHQLCCQPQAVKINFYIIVRTQTSLPTLPPVPTGSSHPVLYENIALINLEREREPRSTMAEDRQPPTVVEGATTGADVEEDVPAVAKSAEDRKAAAALSKLDVHRDDDEATPAREVDQEAVSRAMNQLGGEGKKVEEKKDVKKVKVDAADVALLVSCDPEAPLWGEKLAQGTRTNRS